MNAVWFGSLLRAAVEPNSNAYRVGEVVGEIVIAALAVTFGIILVGQIRRR